MFYNAEWFARLLNSAHKSGLHITWVSDSTGTAGGSASFVTDYVGALSQWRPPCDWAGMQLPDFTGATALGTGATNQVDTTTAAGYDYAFPGMTTPEGNTDGRTVGAMYKWPFTGNRATNGRLRLAIMPDNGYLEKDALWIRRALKARMFVLKTPSGPTEMRLYGIRNDARGAAVNVDLSVSSTGGVDEVLTVVEADIAAGPGNAGVEMTGGAADETSTDVVIGMPCIYDPRGIGIVMDTISMGGWGANSYGLDSGFAITGPPSYTSKLADATIEQYAVASQIAGTRRILFVQIGQNDAAMNEATFKTALTNLITRWRARFLAAGLEAPAFILRSAPDPGYTGIVDPRFDGFDRTVRSLAETMSTSASPIMAACMREMFESAKTVTGSFGADALADTVHRSLTGAQKIEALFWRRFMERVYGPIFGRGGGRVARR